MIFIIIGCVGVALLLLTLVLGDLLDFAFHVDFGGDIFSTSALAGFVAAFGFGAALVHSLTSSLWLTIASGVLAGVLVGALVVKLTHTLKNSTTSGTVKTAGLVGLEATVLSDVPAGGFGQVRVRAHGQQLTLNARSSHPLSAGTAVWISEVVSATAVEVTEMNAELTPRNVTEE